VRREDTGIDVKRKDANKLAGNKHIVRSTLKQSNGNSSSESSMVKPDGAWSFKIS
jgi:hypothetical protein